MDIKDYAYPTIKAERCLRDIHDAVLDKRWDDAQARTKEAIKWIWEIQEALFEMRMKDEA